MKPDECALMAAKAIMTLTRQGLPNEVLLARINAVVRDAIKAASPPPLPELHPGQNATVQQALATIDAARLHRLERERAANDRRLGDERRGVRREQDKEA